MILHRVDLKKGNSSHIRMERDGPHETRVLLVEISGDTDLSGDGILKTFQGTQHLIRRCSRRQIVGPDGGLER